MATTVCDRFQVICSYCGFIGGAKSLAEAVKLSQHAKTKHNSDIEWISIHDIMVHVGCTSSWDAEGTPRERRLG